MGDEEPARSAIAIVIIGRNEGARLQAALDSALQITKSIVYVDSGSTDDSVDQAQSRGIVSLELDNALPYTAARGRNAGYRAVGENFPDPEFVQFLDGDCEILENWIDVALEYFRKHPDAAIVCGRLRERYPEKSVYNLLCDIEWDVPAGEAESCGGIFCIRREAFEKTAGFREDLVAGEELELCSRVRHEGWKIKRLESEMALHDADMMRFSQWWKRSVRCGFTYAQGASELGRESARERNRALFWGALLPLAIMLLALVIGYSALWLLLVYPVQVARLSIRGNRKFTHRLLNGFFTTIEKFPEMLGIGRFYANRIFRLDDRLIEYK